MLPANDRLAMRLIAAFKLAKAVLLLLLGVGALRLLQGDVATTLTATVRDLRIDSDNRIVHTLLDWILPLSRGQLEAISAGTFVYAALLTIEGVGLLLEKHWAEYFTVIVTGSLIPLEVYELFERLTVIKVAVFVLNVAVVIYLVQRLRRGRFARLQRKP